MLSRRRFVQTSSIALTGTACGVAKGSESAAGTADTLPPSIAALTSMKDQATPISVEERRARIDKARRLMAGHKVDALMLTGGTSMVYFTGMQWGLSERMTAVVIPAKGNAFIVTPKFEEERTLEQARTGPLGADTRVLTWEEHASPSALVAQGLRDAGIASGALGVEETVRFVFSNMVATAAPSLRITSGTPVTAGCRMVKDQHELALMRLASQVTLKAYEAAWKALTDGMTQDQFADLVAKAHRRLGFEGGAGVQVGEYSALPHGSVQPQVIREGTILLIDGGCKVEG
jgi:Xaa-Pro dipeptidase